MTKTYDRAYFDRWYRDGGIGDRRRLARKVALAVAVAEYQLERPVRTVLDIGCGEGAWRAPLLKLRPGVRYLGFDSSEYAIARYGTQRNLHYARFGDFAELTRGFVGNGAERGASGTAVKKNSPGHGHH